MKTMKTFTYRIFAICACLMAVMLGGCVKNEFKVDFEFPKDHIGNYMMTYYASDQRGGRWIERTASIQEGVASADGITRLPTIVYVSDASRPGEALALYVERGDRIRIAGEGGDMSSWTVTGNKVSERWSEWRKDAYKKRDDVKSFKNSIEEYVKKNPKDELSSILLLMEWDRRKDPEGFVKLWNSIDKGSRSQRLVETCGASDLTGTYFITTAEGTLEYAKDPKAKTLGLRSRDNGTDTLKFDKPAFLYLFSDNNAARRETLDSLKTLVKGYPDSTKRVMADIYMDSDSMTWINAIRRDSIKSMVRAWQPRSLAEKDMAMMGVSRIPWYIVKDKDGKETYGGDDLKEAVAAFRRLMGKPAAGASKVSAEKEKPKATAEKEKPKASTDKEKPKAAIQKPIPRPNQSNKPR